MTSKFMVGMAPTPNSFTESEATTPLLGTGDMRSNKSKSKRVGSDGGFESAVFSPPAKTRAEELKRVQLLGGTKILKKRFSQEAATPFQQRSAGAAGSITGSITADGPSGQGTLDAVNQYGTNDLLRLLIAEIARMRSTLDNLAQDRLVLAEIQKTNMLLALTLTSGRRLEGYENAKDHPLLVERVKEKARPADVILKTI
jgi:hypothetical protein